MAGLRVFISSTCFDLGSSRDQLRAMLTRMGYEPIMSEYSDILYDPQDHTHVSCVRDIANADMIVLMIGSRFGGIASGQTLPLLDFSVLADASASVDVLSSKEKLSITQLEVLKAIELDIPLFAFVDEKVYADHHVYQNNKLNPILEKIKFPSIDKPETAKYIFEFINLISHRVSNNAIVSYKNFARIEDHLIKQWSLLFQRLLRDRRDSAVDQRRADIVIEQIEGLKAAVLQSISAGAARDIAKSVLRYRRLADVLIGLKTGPSVVNIDEFQGDFQDLLEAYGVTDIVEFEPTGISRAFLVLSDETFYSARIPARLLHSLNGDWDSFKKLDIGVRHAVLEAIESTERMVPIVVYRPENLSAYRQRMEQSYSSLSPAANRLLQEVAPSPPPPPPPPSPKRALKRPQTRKAPTLGKAARSAD